MIWACPPNMDRQIWFWEKNFWPAFIMAQFLGVGYIDIAKAAPIPAPCSIILPSVSWFTWQQNGLASREFPKNACQRPGAFKRWGISARSHSCSCIFAFAGLYPLKSAYYCIITTVVISLVANNWKAWQGAHQATWVLARLFLQCNKQALNDIYWPWKMAAVWRWVFQPPALVPAL